MKAFITGATGFVGSHVARALAAAGADLRLLVRQSSRTENIDALKAERVYWQVLARRQREEHRH